MIGLGRRGFDLALAHGSNDLALAAAALRIPAVNTFDYEWVRQQLRRDGIFDPGAVGRVLDRHTSGAEDLTRQLWGLMAFTLWRRRAAP